MALPPLSFIIDKGRLFAYHLTTHDDSYWAEVSSVHRFTPAILLSFTFRFSWPTLHIQHSRAGQYGLKIKSPIFSYHIRFLILIDFFLTTKDKGLISNMLLLYQNKHEFPYWEWSANLALTKLNLFLNKDLIKQGWIPQFGINKVPA